MNFNILDRYKFFTDSAKSDVSGSSASELVGFDSKKAQLLLEQDEGQPSTSSTLAKTVSLYHRSIPVTRKRMERCLTKSKTVRQVQMVRWKTPVTPLVKVTRTYVSGRHQAAEADQIHRLPLHARPPNGSVQPQGLGLTAYENLARIMDNDISVIMDAVPSDDVAVTWKTVATSVKNKSMGDDIDFIENATDMTDYGLVKDSNRS